MHRKSGFWAVFFSFAMGMGGNLHLAIPSLGAVAMLDLVAYAVAIPLLLLNWPCMGKCMRRILVLSFLWTGSAMIANAFNFVELRYWFKCVTLVSSSWAIIVCAYVVLKDCPTGYLWYLVGAGLSGWISLYYFRNGSLESFATHGGKEIVGSSTEFLMAKQIYPSIAYGIALGCVLPLFIKIRKLPGLFVVVGVFASGVWLLLHGGSRSNFGIFCSAALLGTFVLYGKRLFGIMVKNRFVLVIVGLMGVGLLFLGYKFMALNGVMEEGEAEKFEGEFGEGGAGAINGRAGFKYAISDAFGSCLIGRGWHLRRHSVISNSLSCEGLAGFIFWLYFYWQVLWFVSKRIQYAGKYASFIALYFISASWAVFGSPFGTRHKFFVFMTFVAICRDYPYYGVGAIFSERLLSHLSRRLRWPLVHGRKI